MIVFCDGGKGTVPCKCGETGCPDVCGRTTAPPQRRSEIFCVRDALRAAFDFVDVMSNIKEPPAHLRIIAAQERAKMRPRPR